MRLAVWDSYRAAVSAHWTRVAADQSVARSLKEAIDGRTGIDCFDAWIRELNDTGYLHNHARMWFASIWIFTLDLPWVLGADLFLSKLLDGDPASNTLSWRWVAGLQTRDKTYLARPDNTERFTEGRFRAPPGSLAEVAQAVEGPPPPPAFPFGAFRDAPRRPPVGVWVHREDLSPDWLVNQVPAMKIAVLWWGGDDATGDMLPVRFTAGALSDTRKRLGEAGRTVEDVGHPDGRFADPVAWAEDRKIPTIVTPYAPTGPCREYLDGLRPRARAAGIEIVAVARRWDRAAWPHATKGFSPFKRRIPEFLKALGA